LQADIYFKVFKNKILDQKIELCVLNSCATTKYSNLFPEADTNQISKPNPNQTAIDILLNYEFTNGFYYFDQDWKYSNFNLSKEYVVGLLHDSRYPNVYHLDISSPVNLQTSITLDKFQNYSLQLKFMQHVIEIPSTDIPKLLLISQDQVYVNPLYLLNQFQEAQVQLQSPQAVLEQRLEIQGSHYLPDIQALVTLLNTQLNQPSPARVIQVPKLFSIPSLSIKNPKYADFELQKHSFTTFRGSNANRIHNIQTAINQLETIYLEPNQEISFLQQVGKINYQTGYKDALIITSQGFDPQAGGGVCQVSSTVYLAALQAGLDILERHNHSKAVSYYAQDHDYGLDASIYPGVKDLRFINSFDFPVLFLSYYLDYQMHVLILAPKQLPSVELELLSKQVVHVEPRTIFQGEESSSPLVIQTYMPKMRTLWERTINQQKEEIVSNYLYQPEIIRYSNS